MERGLRLTGAEVLSAAGMVAADVILRGGRFSAQIDAQDRNLRLDGLWLLPGIVDLHGDGFERHLAPRRGMVSDLGHSLRPVEAELAQNGITTAWAAQFWSWEGGMRGPAFATRFAKALSGARDWLRLDLRMQLRVEAHMIEDGDAIRDLVSAHGIDYLVINDHLPHRHLKEGRKPPRLTGSALKAGRSPDAHLALMRHMAANAPEVDGFVKGLVRDLGATTWFGSHDDPDGQTRAHWQGMGLDIAEFPTSFAAAEVAKAQGSPVVMGAPNVVRGGSHNKSVSASDLLRAGLVDALASDYHYPAMVAAAFALSDQAVCSFAAAWALISARPAAVMGLEDRGEIAPGKRADFLVLDPRNRQVLGCFAAGRPVFLSGALADAVMG